MKEIISLALCLVLGGFVLSGCSNSSEPFTQKSYTPDTQISEINLDVRDREIEVSLSEDEQVHIQYSENHLHQSKNSRMLELQIHFWDNFSSPSINFK